MNFIKCSKFVRVTRVYLDISRERCYLLGLHEVEISEAFLNQNWVHPCTILESSLMDRRQIKPKASPRGLLCSLEWFSPHPLFDLSNVFWLFFLFSVSSSFGLWDRRPLMFRLVPPTEQEMAISGTSWIRILPGSGSRGSYRKHEDRILTDKWK